MSRILAAALTLAASPAFAASGPFFSLKNTDFIVLISFLLFIGVLVYFKVPGLLAALLDKRAAQIRADLLADWKLAQGQRAARDKARALIKAVEGGQGFAEAARAAGPNIGTVQTIGGRRGELGAGGQPIPPELALLFSMAEGSVKTLEVPGNRGWMVLSLAKVNRPDPKAVDPEIVASVAGQLGPAFGNELVTQMMADARKRVGVQINDKLLEQLRKELTGDLPVAE
ncbi:MAG TPA: hypothetical protein PKC77_02265 [Sphingopyxis sp.]|nr:hypothetical protein [Sphingopyxis sp.]